MLIKVSDLNPFTILYFLKLYLQPTINLKFTIITFAGAGLSRVLRIPFVLKFHLVLPIWETSKLVTNQFSRRRKTFRVETNSQPDYIASKHQQLLFLLYSVDSQKTNASALDLPHIVF